MCLQFFLEANLSKIFDITIFPFLLFPYFLRCFHKVYYYYFKKQPPEMFLKKGVLKKFAKITDSCTFIKKETLALL